MIIPVLYSMLQYDNGNLQAPLSGAGSTSDSSADTL